MVNPNYRNVAFITLFVGVTPLLMGLLMGGFNSVTWSGLIGAGIALIFHGGLTVIGSFLITSSRKQAATE